MRSEKRTYTYKTVGECEIKADVYSSFDGQARPVIVWVHGGALIMGHREDLPLRERDLYLTGGYQVVSVDYRLAPETKLAAIIEDVQDACEWVREAGPGLFDGEPAAFVPLCPVRNVTRGYPATLLLHGDRDTDVPCEQSAMMAEALAAAGVEHELVTIPGGEHGFDAQDDAVTADAFERVEAFLEARL
jgi:acetyl esterase/lipase